MKELYDEVRFVVNLVCHCIFKVEVQLFVFFVVFKVISSRLQNPNALCISEGSLTFTVDHMLEIHQLNSQFVNHYYTMRQVFAPLWRWCPSTPSQQNHVHPDAGFLELAVLEKIDEWLQLPTTLDITEDAQTQKMEIIDMDRGV